MKSNECQIILTLPHWENFTWGMGGLGQKLFHKALEISYIHFHVLDPKDMYSQNVFYLLQFFEFHNPEDSSLLSEVKPGAGTRYYSI